MARTTTKTKKASTRKPARVTTIPRKLKVVAGKQGPKPGRETLKKSARKVRAQRMTTGTAPAVNDAILPKDFEKTILEMASGPDGVTRAMLVRRSGQSAVAWRPWVQKLAEKHGLEYSVSMGKPVFRLTKVAARKRA